MPALNRRIDKARVVQEEEVQCAGETAEYVAEEKRSNMDAVSQSSFSDLDCAGVDVRHRPPKESDAAR